MAWNKGLTKLNNQSVLKISETMKRKKIDNFSEWRDRMRRDGKIPTRYPQFRKDGNLAELIGVVLGDGSIHKYKRTEGLRIVLNGDNLGSVERYSLLVEKVFKKKPSTLKRKNANCFDIRLYQKKISERMGIPCGARRDVRTEVPLWILQNHSYVIRYLRGLYEAEGSHCVHPSTYTHKFIFSNRNESLLDIVYVLLKKLGFSPHRTKEDVQISKKSEVERAVRLLEFRKY